MSASNSASFIISGAVLVAMELHDQQTVGLPDQHLVDRRPVDRDGAAQVDHGPIDEFDRLGVQGDDMPRRLHRLAERRKLTDPQHLARLDRVQRQLDRRGECQGSLGSDQQTGEIVTAGRARGRGQGVDVVATDAAKLFGEAGGDLLGLGRAQDAQALDQVGDRGGDAVAQIVRGEPEPMPGSVG